MKKQVLQLLKEFKDVFAWTYVQMRGLDPQLVSHKLNIKEGCKPVKQVLRDFVRVRSTDQRRDSEATERWLYQTCSAFNMASRYRPSKKEEWSNQMLYRLS